MSLKCVHKGCGKKFSNPEDDCVYHPGPPIFHEGQKGWKCCKPRVLTFDEFLSITPCTTGKHSTVDDTPVPEPAPRPADDPPAPAPRAPIAISTGQGAAARVPQTTNTPGPSAAPPVPESDSDDPSLPIPPNTTCRRRGCQVSSSSETSSSRKDEKCVYHPGFAVFHEGTKGWTCCKRRVLEFDEFLQIKGCQNKDRHMFIGSAKKKKKPMHDSGEEKIENVRHDFYQTSTTVHASIYLKKINKSLASIVFSTNSVNLDLPTTDNKRYITTLPLYGSINTKESTWKIMGTKMDLTLVKSDEQSWPVLRADESAQGMIVQVGRAGKA